jgi:hypothetical protein
VGVDGKGGLNYEERKGIDWDLEVEEKIVCVRSAWSVRSARKWQNIPGR